MAEISRENAYEIAEFNLGIFGEATEMAKFIRKAISDMQKLEKIEKILFPENNMCGGQICATCDYEGGVDCINERMIDLCKQILKE